MLLNGVGFWTPIRWESRGHRIEAEADDYFSYLGGRPVVVIKNSETLCKNSKDLSRGEKALELLFTVVKILSLMTIILPAIILAIKLYSRYGVKYQMEDESTKPLITDNSKIKNSSEVVVQDAVKRIPVFDLSVSDLTDEEASSTGSDSPRVDMDDSPFIERVVTVKMGFLEANYPNGAVEQIRTLNTVQRAKQILTEEIKSLEDQPESAARIARCQQMLAACDKFDGFDKPANIEMDDFDQWLGSWYFRALISDHFNQLPEDANEREYLEAYKRGVAEFIASPVNLREQSVSSGAEALSFLRAGALYDPTNPYTHLSELKSIAKGEISIEDKRAEIEGVRQSNKNNPRIVATTTFALEQLDQLEETIKIREENLQRLALQMVWAQVEIALQKKEPFPGAKLKIGHIGLLNEDNIGVDKKSGWYHHEGYEIQDMAAVYAFLHGKHIVFDNTGPHIDELGIIHLPYVPEQGHPEINLEAAFFNISIQGKLKNKGKQQTAINRQSAQIIKAKKFPLKKPKGRKVSSVEHAATIHHALETAGFQTALSCLSGKDRTGWVAYQVVLDRIEKSGQPRPQGLKTPGFGILKEVLKQNYGKGIIKVTKKRLKGVGVQERAKLTGKQVKDFTEKPAPLRGRQGGKPINFTKDEVSEVGSPSTSDDSESDSSD